MKSALFRLLLALAVVLVLYAGLSVLATFSQLADAADRVLAGAGQPVFWGLTALFGGLAAWPLLLWWRLPRMRRPPPDTTEPAYSRHQTWLRQHLAQHPDPQVQTLARRDDLNAALAELDARANALIQQTAGGLFVSTALIQNGRLDSLLMLGAQLRLVWQLAALYRLRPTPAQISYLYGNVAGTMLLSSQLEEVDFAELATPIVTSVAPSLVGAAPGLQGVGQLLVNSLANGAANAFLTLRVGLVAKAYCAPRVAPEPQAVRAQATQAALALLGQLTKEQGARVVQGVWAGVKRQTGNAFNQAVQSTRKAAQAVAETTTNVTTETMAKASETAQSMGRSGKAVASGMVEVTQRAGSALSSTAKETGQAVRRASKAAADQASRLFERDQTDEVTPKPTSSGEQGSLL